MTLEKDSSHVHLVEIFASIQGEGLYVGQPQLFVRLGGCPLRCLYCDTPAGLEPPARYLLHLGAAQRSGLNPLGCEELLALIGECDRDVGAQRAISITGGEPLHQAGFLSRLLPILHERRQVHLETAGVHPGALRALADAVDHLSMDWKLDSTLERGSLERRHEEFLRTALAAALEVCVKIVLTPAVSPGELSRALERIRACSADVPVVLQPVSPARAVETPLEPGELAALVALAESLGGPLRVIPQVQGLLGLR